jgi:hypothetical protein
MSLPLKHILIPNKIQDLYVIHLWDNRTFRTPSEREWLCDKPQY